MRGQFVRLDAQAQEAQSGAVKDCRGDAQRVCFAGSVNVSQHEMVGMGECVRKFVEKCFGTCVSVRLENAPYFIVIGLGLGYVMQRSRFCFTAAYRDPTLTGETKLTKAVIVAFALCTIMFFGFQSSHVDLADPSTYPGNPINISLVFGAFIFGVGAVLAGGCASGTFVRIGEGYVQNLIALVFFIFGSVFGNAITSRIGGTFMTAGSKVYLPAVLGGHVPALLVQLAALLLLWIAADRWEKRKRG